jgi:polynucleotide 5'-kinase involved in rRNA processing
MDRIDNRSEWLTFETKAKSINQERRSEEVQLEKLKLRLQDKMQQVELRDRAPTAA